MDPIQSLIGGGVVSLYLFHLGNVASPLFLLRKVNIHVLLGGNDLQHNPDTLVGYGAPLVLGGCYRTSDTNSGREVEGSYVQDTGLYFECLPLPQDPVLNLRSGPKKYIVYIPVPFFDWCLFVVS